MKTISLQSYCVVKCQESVCCCVGFLLWLTLFGVYTSQYYQLLICTWTVSYSLHELWISYDVASTIRYHWFVPAFQLYKDVKYGFKSFNFLFKNRLLSFRIIRKNYFFRHSIAILFKFNGITKNWNSDTWTL